MTFEVINGSAGDDVFTHVSGNKVYFGGDGNDSFQMAAGASGQAVFVGGGGNDSYQVLPYGLQYIRDIGGGDDSIIISEEAFYRGGQNFIIDQQIVFGVYPETVPTYSERFAGIEAQPPALVVFGYIDAESDFIEKVYFPTLIAPISQDEAISFYKSAPSWGGQFAREDSEAFGIAGSSITTAFLNMEQVASLAGQNQSSTSINSNLLTPDIAENGGVVPVRLDLTEPMVAGDTLTIYADGNAAYVLTISGDESIIDFRGRVRLVDGLVEAEIVRGNSDTERVTAEVEILGPGFIPSGADESKTFTTRSDDRFSLLIENQMPSDNHISEVEITTRAGSINVEMSSYVASNPYISLAGLTSMEISEPEILLDSESTESNSFDPSHALSAPLGDHTITVIADIFGEVLILEDLTETVTSYNHTVEYNGAMFDYSEVDAFVMTVTRNDEFTTEFAQEISDAYPSQSGISYGTAVALIGQPNINSTLLAVAGADGNYVG